MESVWLLLNSVPVDPFGFSRLVAFRCENPCSDVLDFLGFPWILSSESRLFNGLRGLKWGSFFLALLPSAFKRELAFLACGRAGLFIGKLNLVSDFLQAVVVRAIPFWTHQFKKGRARASARMSLQLKSTHRERLRPGEKMASPHAAWLTQEYP